VKADLKNISKIGIFPETRREIKEELSSVK